MKKLFAIVFTSFLMININANIKFDIDKFHFLVVTFVDNKSLSIDIFRDDLRKSFDIASTKKCKGIAFVDSKNIVFKYIDDFDFSKSDSIINDMCNLYNQTEIIKTKGKHLLSGGKNVIKTYRNGELISTTKSDAVYGPLEYKKTVSNIGGDIYETEMYYEAPTYNSETHAQSKLKTIYK
jgi:hypothetical protein